MNFLIFALVGCTGSPQTSQPIRPGNVPDDAIEIHLTPEALFVGDHRIADRAALEVDLVDGLFDPLVDALAGGENAWIHAPGDTPWVIVRKLIVSANEAGRSARWVSSDGRAHGPSHKPRARFRPSCPDGGYAIEGISRRISIEIFTGSDGSWVEASAHFAPTVEGSAALSLPVSCWQPTRCDLVADDRRPSCDAARSGSEAPGRVQIAGPIGCMLPIRKQPGDETQWPKILSANLKGLGVGSNDESTLVIEALTPWSVVVAVLDGFADADLPAPLLGLPLVEGHGRPPLCTATIRDSATLETAAAKWLGSRVGVDSDIAEPVEDPL